MVQKPKPKPAPKPAPKAASKPRAKAAPDKDARTPLLEWIAAGVGLVMILALIGLLVMESLAPKTPASLEVRRLGAPHGQTIEVEVRNTGGTTAAGVTIEGELAIPGAMPETAEATFDYVAAGSSRKGGLVFKSDPAAGTVTVRAKGYVDP